MDEIERNLERIRLGLARKTKRTVSERPSLDSERALGVKGDQAARRGFWSNLKHRFGLGV